MDDRERPTPLRFLPAERATDARRAIEDGSVKVGEWRGDTVVSSGGEGGCGTGEESGEESGEEGGDAVTSWRLPISIIAYRCSEVGVLGWKSIVDSGYISRMFRRWVSMPLKTPQYFRVSVCVCVRFTKNLRKSFEVKNRNSTKNSEVRSRILENRVGWVGSSLLW